ncbi:uncharacterized protein LOC134235881 isoform X2 [Saccostrea cucullata]|uniref:uncharacterized protein LOC134235881 isoform X2 n=1 Tax=Saccostrea cuccullata TaxID=36930 RepID=UPI002ED43B04
MSRHNSSSEMIGYLLLVGVSVSVVPGVVSKCCLPLQGQTYTDALTSLSGSPQEKRFTQMMFSYDAKARKFANTYLTQPEGNEFNSIQDFAAGKVYSWNRNTCQVSPSGAFYNICIPAEAKPVQKTFMGVAPDIINLDTYMRRQNNYTLFYRLGLNCTFVEIGASSSILPQPGRQLLYVFYNTTMGIKDPSVFIPPKMCFKNVTKIARKPCFQPNHIINYLGDPNPCFP